MTDPLQQVIDAWEDIVDPRIMYNTTVDKLYRAEDVTVEPDGTITFKLERHASTVNGSIWAQVHHWRVDLKKGTADVDPHHKRMVGKPDARLNTKKLAAKVADEIDDGVENKYLVWLDDLTVRVVLGDLVTAGNLQTQAARRKRFRRDMNAEMESRGYLIVKKANLMIYRWVV